MPSNKRKRKPTGTCYLLHFDQPVSPFHTCQHYLGWTPGAVEERVADHGAGRGARLTEVAAQRGIGMRLVRTWPDVTRDDERRLKDRHERRRLCPLCNSEAMRRAA